jgi:tRNA dimethylallyltransferase
MFAAGLVAETRHLLNAGLAQNRTARQAIGYRQVVDHLQGDRTLAETIELVKTRTRQFAKRQRTWFRKHAEARWIELAPTDGVDGIVDRLNLN